MSTCVAIRGGRRVGTLPPCDLLAERALGPERPAAARPHGRGLRITQRRLRRTALIPIVLTATAALGVVAWASHASAFINLTVANASVSHNGALWIQGGNAAGTGQFDPFLTLSPSGNRATTRRPRAASSTRSSAAAGPTRSRRRPSRP